MKLPQYVQSTSKNCLDQLTISEQRQHRRAIEKLLEALFQHNTPADYKIVGDSIRCTYPTLFVFATHAGGERRDLALGGIRFLTTSGRQEQTYEVTVEHAGDDRFNIFVIIQGSDGKHRYTRVAETTRFQQLDQYLLYLLNTLRKE